MTTAAARTRKLAVTENGYRCWPVPSDESRDFSSGGQHKGPVFQGSALE